MLVLLLWYSLLSLIRFLGSVFYKKPGRAEAAFAKHDCLSVMKKFLLITRTDYLVAPPDTEIIDHLEIPSTIPDWITEEEIQVYAEKFQRSGFTGPLNYYRSMDM